jgi:hypothetical protein
MDSLNDILARKDFSEPPEAAAIKQYVQDEFGIAVSVQVRERDIIIATPSAALANTLRLRSPVLRKLSQTDKRLVFRIG